MSNERLMNKQVIYMIYTGYNDMQSREDKILNFTSTWIELKYIMLSEISQWEKNWMISLNPRI